MATSWATEQEITFIKKLGSHREGHEITPMRLELLMSYVQAARHRLDWGNMNGEKIIQFAERAAAHPEVLSTSAETGAGIDVLRAEIAALVE
jgi:hypothetical protein